MYSDQTLGSPVNGPNSNPSFGKKLSDKLKLVTFTLILLYKKWNSKIYHIINYFILFDELLGPSNKQMDDANAKKKPRTVKQLTRTMTDFLTENHRESKGYSAFGITVFCVYWFLSDGDFSFLLTLASMISCASFFMLALYQETTRSCVGISAKMMQCYLILWFT